jgi:hypothetical protein
MYAEWWSVAHIVADRSMDTFESFKQYPNSLIICKTTDFTYFSDSICKVEAFM